jgi:hypothetical protein
LELEPKADGVPVELIVPLTPDGQGKHTQPLPPKTRMIDVRAGDHVRHKGKRHKVRAIKAYRDNTIDAERVPHVTDGYVVKGT